MLDTVIEITKGELMLMTMVSAAIGVGLSYIVNTLTRK